ncbi:MAG: flagellar motor protein MotB [Treponema sp.]|uniref:flagellar motor protein MotB n=1 Tax=Treponema bryantii TaxID=163 RepID=UPI0003B6CC98|nr:flagellar motor protein MotB [Treponema bryantii]MBS7267131.1 flagellar motor protein MotB [Treponema sp.]MCI6591737.1 flagellar motor protein MotB [Spirochaetia bacterium]MDD7534781.1 flagellar motor protein MotB [Treponema sp.]MDY3721451.1 flagellar motor protein MotB [Treponema sp.]MDY5757742.1 flagellar motor protein MotB [Treponema sp.]
MGKKAKQPEKPSTAWLGTYGDMITLMLCFFVMLYNPSEVDVTQMATITQSLQMQETETTSGGLSLSAGQLSDLGNNINSLPSLEKGKSLGLAKKKAVSLFAPDVKSNKITITSDERGLIITLLSDNFFEEGSAELNINDTRETLLRLADFFRSDELKGRRFRIEGHTDSTPVAENSIFPSNWELSATRAVNVLHYLADYGVRENDFSVAGYSDTRPKFSNDTAEGRAYNRRVDIIILDEGHF